MHVARLTWQALDPDVLVADLARRLGVAPLAGSRSFDLGSAVLHVVPWEREGPGDRPLSGGRLMLEPVADTRAEAVDGAVLAESSVRLVGIGWSTVELERAAGELSPWLEDAAPGRSGLEAPAVDPQLGARTLVRRTAGLPADVMVLLEASTEGRVAASLARHGEGPCAIYLRPAGGDLDAWLARASGRGVRAGRRGLEEGPLGRQALLAGCPPAGPHVILTTGNRPSPSPSAGEYHPVMNDAASVTVRDATAEDAGRFAALLTDEGYPAGATDLAARIEIFSTPESRVLAAEAGGEVVGFIAYHVLPRFEVAERFGRIVALVVDPGVRERGIGRLLMQAAEKRAVASGASFIEVTAGHHRPDAKRLFESLGYDANLAAYLRKRP